MLVQHQIDDVNISKRRNFRNLWDIVRSMIDERANSKLPAARRVWTVNDTLLNRTLVVGFVIRVVMIVLGEILDHTLQLKYTDVDYHVFTDGSRYVAKGMSPYERATYRYSPWLAVALLPNVYFAPWFGKLMFSAADVMLGWYIYQMELSSGKAAPSALLSVKVS